MLPYPAPFPHAGAFARLRGRDRRIVRIQQCCADGRLLVTAPPPPAHFGTDRDGRTIIITPPAINRRVTRGQLARAESPVAHQHPRAGLPAGKRTPARHATGETPVGLPTGTRKGDAS